MYRQNILHTSIKNLSYEQIKHISRIYVQESWTKNQFSCSETIFHRNFHKSLATIKTFPSICSYQYNESTIINYYSRSVWYISFEISIKEFFCLYFWYLHMYHVCSDPEKMNMISTFFILLGEKICFLFNVALIFRDEYKSTKRKHFIHLFLLHRVLKIRYFCFCMCVYSSLFPHQYDWHRNRSLNFYLIKINAFIEHILTYSIHQCRKN